MASNFQCPPCDPEIDQQIDEEVKWDLFNSLMSSTVIDPSVFQDPDLQPTNLTEYWESFKLTEKGKERRRKLKQEHRQVEEIVAKLKHHEPLTEAEVEFYQEKHLQITHLLEPLVEVDAVKLLEDIVKGDYTLEDVHSAREGIAAASAKDPSEKSPLQLLDEITESRKKKITGSLNTSTGQFFANLDGSAKGKHLPTELKDAVNQAATAIELSFEHQPGDKNEASEAIESYIMATVMNEAEMKLKKTGEMMEQDNEKKAEEELDLSDGRTLGFDITGLDYNITLVPTDDSDVYKPLEIISYIGLTGKTDK